MERSNVWSEVGFGNVLNTRVMTCSSTKTPYVKDCTVEGPPINLQYSTTPEQQAALETALVTCCAQFSLLHTGYETNRDLKFLMTDPADINTIMSATCVGTYEVLRPELTTHNCMFKEINTSTMYEKLGRIQSVVTRHQVNECRQEIYNEFRWFIMRLRNSEANVSSALSRFLSKAAMHIRARHSTVADPEISMNRICGARGILAKLGVGVGIDEDAGFYCRGDFIVQFGCPQYKDRILLVSELKHFDFQPKEATWIAQDDNLLVQLLGLMVGNLAPLGLALTNYGLKLLIMEVPTDDSETGEGTDCFLWPPGQGMLSFTAQADLAGAFEFFLELIRLSVRLDGPLMEIDFNEVAVTNTRGLKSQSDTLKNGNNVRRRSRSSAKDKKLTLTTTCGRTLDVWSMDMDARFTPEEQRLLLKKLREEEEGQDLINETTNED